jgi:hypothetical protein
MTKIILANQSHLDELARLFNLYRIFYEQEDDFDRAYDFIGDRLMNEESIIFVSSNKPPKLSGFVQLYPSYCSVSTIPILILYDLYVDQEKRGTGRGKTADESGKRVRKRKWLQKIRTIYSKR